MTALALKSLLAISLALSVVIVARGARASTRHLVLSALFGFLLLLPVVQHFAPAIAIPVTPRPRAESSIVHAAAAVMAPDAATTAAARPRGTGLALWHLAAGVYLLGCLALAGSLASGIRHLHRLARRGVPSLRGTRKVKEMAGRFGIGQPALVLLSDEVTVPMTFGLRRSTILIPASAGEWSDEDLSRALRHELEHVRRGDWLLQMMARLACAMYWPNPMVWMAWRRFCLEAERACDDAVVGEGTAPEAYAGQLVALARSVGRISAVPALHMAAPSRLSVRVRAILDPAAPRGPHARYAAAFAWAATLLLLGSVAPARLVAAVHDRVSDVSYVMTGTASPAEALVYAAERGDVDEVRRLLDSGVGVNTVVLGDGTALIGAARGRQQQMIELLLERGAGVDVAAPGDGSPLIVAAREGSAEAVDLFLDRGADIDRIVYGDDNPLIEAVRGGHEDVVRTLIRRGADVNVVSVEGTRVRRPLALARQSGSREIEQMLLAAGARP